jgi:spore germination protein YaaH
MAEDARALGVRTLALWRLGLEDPAVWTALGVR